MTQPNDPSFPEGGAPQPEPRPVGRPGPRPATNTTHWPEGSDYPRANRVDIVEPRRRGFWSSAARYVIFPLIFILIGMLICYYFVKPRPVAVVEQTKSQTEQVVAATTMPAVAPTPVVEKTIMVAPATPAPVAPALPPEFAPTTAPAPVIGTYIGAGKESDHVRVFRLEELEVIVKDVGPQTVLAVVSDEHLPILVKTNQPAPPVAGLGKGDVLIPCSINIRPETPNIFKPIWVVKKASVVSSAATGMPSSTP